MAEAFVRTLKRNYVRTSVLPDAESVLQQISVWLAHFNDLHPHRALGYRSRREFDARSTDETLSGLYGATTVAYRRPRRSGSRAASDQVGWWAS
jgi:transposase InsO family protein